MAKKTTTKATAKKKTAPKAKKTVVAKKTTNKKDEVQEIKVIDNVIGTEAFLSTAKENGTTGVEQLIGNDYTPTGEENVFIGYNSMSGNTTGSNSGVFGTTEHIIGMTAGGLTSIDNDLDVHLKDDKEETTQEPTKIIEALKTAEIEPEKTDKELAIEEAKAFFTLIGNRPFNNSADFTKIYNWYRRITKKDPGSLTVQHV